MPQNRPNGITVPINSDAYKLTADLATMADSINNIIKVANAAARDNLASTMPGGTIPVPTFVWRSDLAAVEVWDGTAWKFPPPSGGIVAPFGNTQSNYDYSGPVTVTPLADGRKRVDVTVSMVRKTTANPMTSASQDMGVVLPSIAQGAANSIILSCPLDNGVAGNTSTASIFAQLSPSTGKLFIWAPTSFSWAPGRVATINCVYYI